MTPEIGTELAKGDEAIETGKTYEILTAEKVTTEVRSLSGIRVTLADAKNETISVMLWERPVTSAGSKLGAFMVLLGSNTDKWLGKKIVFKDWRQGARVIELVK